MDAMSSLGFKASAAGILGASLLFAQSTGDLTKVLDQYLAAVKAKDFQKIISLYHAAAKKAVLTDFETPEEQKNFLAQIAEMAPDAYAAPEVSTGGDRVILRIMAKKNIPPAIQKKAKLPPTMEKPMVVDFMQEGGQWKMGPPSFHTPVPAQATVGPKDLNMGVRTDYKEGANTQLGGPILRLEKQAAGTVYVVRMLDEEIAAFVPEKLVQPDFETGKILVMQGASHKQDAQKFWAEDAKLHQP
jgi:hypothetical protein